MFLVVLVIGFNLIPAHLNLSRAPMYKVQITVLIHKINVCKIIWLKKVDTWTDFFLKYLHFLHSVQSKIRLELVSDPVFYLYSGFHVLSSWEQHFIESIPTSLLWLFIIFVQTLENKTCLKYSPIWRHICVKNFYKQLN